MADKTVVDVNPNIKVTDNLDNTWSVSCEDVNSDDALTALEATQIASEAILLDTADIEVAAEAMAVITAAIFDTDAVRVLKGGITLLGNFSTAEQPLAESIAVTYDCELISVQVIQSAQSTTSENLTMTVNRVLGAAYDSVEITEPLNVGTQTNWLFPFEGEGVILQDGDSLDFAFPNTETRTNSILVWVRRI